MASEVIDQLPNSKMINNHLIYILECDLKTIDDDIRLRSSRRQTSHRKLVDYSYEK